MALQAKPRAIVVITFIVAAGLWGDYGRRLAHAYSQGAPEGACLTMRPQHGAPPQSAPSPYNLLVSSPEIGPSQIVTVTIKGRDIKGFMVMAYSSDFPVGHIIPTHNNTKLICDGLAVTHTTPHVKTEVSFEWKAPEDVLEGTRIDFKATVVKSHTVYWMDVVPSYPLVLVETPPGLPPVVATGGPSGDTTPDRVPPGVLPTSGTTVSVTTRITTPGSYPGHLEADASCGQQKACFHDCQASGQCTFIISWVNVDPDTLAMTLTYRLPDPHQHWIAVGFSKDQEMGDDSVTECIMHDGEVEIKQSFNEGLDNQYLDDRHAGLSEQSGTVENGILSCTFLRKKTYPRDPLVFDLNDDYFLLVAMGEALNGNKMPHTFDVLPPVSDHRIDLQGLENVEGEEPPVSLLVQLHGILMIISWVMLTSIGILTAKYGKPMFPKVNPCGANIWFQIHRGCMVAVTLMTVVGVVLMFIQCDGYCQIPQMPGKSHWPLHPPLGILVLVLAIINPIMAFFRPAPKAPNRFVFNWSHWGVGVLGWIMASFAVLIGLTLERAHAPPEAMYVMVVWGIYHILLLVAMETLPRPLRKVYSAMAEKTLQRGRVYNLERAHQDNLGYVAEDGDTNCTPVRAPENPDAKMKEKADKELTREELKVQRLLLIAHYGIVVTLTFTLLLVVYLYTPHQH